MADAPRPSRHLLVFGYLAIALLTLTIVEVSAYIFGRTYLLVRVPFLLYAAPSIDHVTWQHYMEVRDPVLGWPSSQALHDEHYDRSGSRPVPAFPRPGNECVTLYGDSYTYGAEVSDEEAWGNVLARQAGCRVGNFGVGGYGTDQAVMRFEANLADSAAISILGLFPVDMLRNVNQYRHLRTGESPLGFKPRFIADGDSLRLVPMPQLTFSQVQQLAGDMQAQLPNEVFLPGTALGPVPFEFPHLLALGKLLLHPQVRHWLAGRPSWVDYLQPSHPSGALEVTAGLCRRFMTRCVERDKEGFVLLLPTPSSYQYYVAKGELIIQPLVDQLETAGIRYLALTPAFARELDGRSFGDVITNWPKPGMGHLNARGNAMVGQFVLDFIVESDFPVPGLEDR